MNFEHIQSFIYLMALSIIFVACSGNNDQQNDSYTDAMSHEHHGETPTATGITFSTPSEPVASENIYYGNDDEFSGYFAQPMEVDSNAPAVILIHEWWGLNENIQTMTEILAGEGYRVLAVDFYDGQVAQNSDESQQFMRAAMQEEDKHYRNLSAASAFLRNEGAPKVAIMGWCFGGAWTLNGAINLSSEFDAGVIYYGRVNSDPDQLSQIEIPLLGIFGAEDRGIPVEGVREFERVLLDLDKEIELYIFDDADHAFANPSGARYNEEAAKDAWAKTLEFLNRNLR